MGGLGLGGGFDHVLWRVVGGGGVGRGEGGGVCVWGQGGAGRDEALQLRIGFVGGDAAEPGPELRGDIFRLHLASEAAAGSASAGARSADDAVSGDDDVVLRVEVAGVELLRIDDGVGEFELVE